MKQFSSSTKVGAIAILVGAVAFCLFLRGRVTEGKSNELVLTQAQAVGETQRPGPEGGASVPAPSSGAISEKRQADMNPLAVAIRQSTTRMKYLDHCLKSEDCDFSKETPSGYALEVGAQLKAELKEYQELARYEMDGGRSLSDEAQSIGRYFAFNGSDDVKLAAIELLGMAEPSPENLAAILSGIERSASPVVMRVGLKEAERYIDSPARAEIEAFQIDMIARGPRAVQLEAARNGEFMCGERVEDYAALERRADPRSQLRQYLELNLEECRHRRQGG